MKKKCITIIMVFILLLLLQAVAIMPSTYAACYKTISGNDYTIDFNSDNTKITSITVNFSYIDNVNLTKNGANNSNRQYNLIFTKDASKKGCTSNGQGGVSINNLAKKLGITDAIYSKDAVVGQSGVTYTRKEFSEGDILCGTQIGRSSDGCCTLISGTYTITDRSVLGKFEPNTTYYGLLCSGFSNGSASWYTSVSIDVEITENKSFILLDESTKPEIIGANGNIRVQDGDVLSVSTNADEITYNWYYDDDVDGIPDEGTFLGSGITYTVKCPDVDDPAHDDTGHKIICVAIQNKDENGNALAEELKPKQVSRAISVRDRAKDISSTSTVTQKDNEKLIYDGTEKEPTIIVKDGENTLTEGIDYDVQYIGVDSTNYGPSKIAPTELGKYKAIITFKEDYTGVDKEVIFDIIPFEQNDGDKKIITEVIEESGGLEEEEEEADDITSEESQLSSTTKIRNPETGDSGITIWVGLFIVSLLGFRCIKKLNK